MQVIGQSHLQQQFLQTLQQNTFAHAHLFWGNAGTGKLAMALWIAQTLNCPHRTEKGACLQCESCQKTAKLIHPDITWLLPTYKNETEKKRTAEDFIPEIREFLLEHHFYPSYAQWVDKLDAYNKQTAITVEDIRQLKQKMSFSSFEGKFKVVILWHAEKMRTEAANAFLKLLEEPPSNTIFILTAPAPEQVLPTVLSRCQSTFFPALQEHVITNYLIDVHKTDSVTAHKIAFLAQGNLNEAVRLIEQDTHIFDEIAKEWLRACYAVKMVDMQAISENIAKMSRETQKNFLVYLLSILRNTLVAHYHIQELLFVPDSMKEFVIKFGNTLSPQAFGELYTVLNQAMEYINRNINSKILYITLSVRISIILNKNKKQVISTQ